MAGLKINRTGTKPHIERGTAGTRATFKPVSLSSATALNAAALAAKEAAEAARDDVIDFSQVDTSDDVVSTLLKGTAGAGPKTRGELTATIGDVAAPIAVILPVANGTDDTAAVQAVLDANPGLTVRGRPGEHYEISSPWILDDDTALVMDGCQITLLAGNGKNMVTNRHSKTPQRSLSDGVSTLGSTTVTSATAAFTGADVGRTVVLADAAGGSGGLGPLVAKIASVTNGTTVVLTAPAHKSVTGKSLKIFDRNKNSSVKGGTWHRGNNSGTAETDRHSFYFRHVDNITIDIDRYDALNGKFCVSLGDVDGYHVTLRDLDTTSDGCHVAGPAFNGEIPYVSGHTVDDMVAFTCNDYAGYNDVAGDIIGCKVGALYPNHCRQGFKILAGAGFHADGIVVDLIKGTTTDNGAWIGDDVGQPSTTGGTYGSVEIRHLDVQPTGAAGFNNLYLVCPNAERIKVKVRVPVTNTLTQVAARVAGASTCTIKELILEDCDFNGTALTTAFANQAAGATIDRLSMVRSRVGGTAAMVATTAGTIKDFNASEPNIDNTTGPTAGLYVNGGTVENAVFTDAKATLGPAGYFVRKNNGTLGKVTFVRGRYTGAYVDEVQSITQGGSGLTSYTLTLSGQTTASIAQAASAATVQAAIEALSNVGAGNVEVTGSAGGPYSARFKGALAGTNIAQMTSTPTGGSGTVVVATTTGGAGAGSLMYRGFNSGVTDFVFDGPEITTFSRVAQMFDASTVILRDTKINGLISPAFHAVTGALTLVGNAVGTFTLFSRAGSEVVNVRGQSLRADLSLLAKTKGDTAYNTNGALSCGDGPCISDGTNWKNLYSGATY